MNKEYVYHVAYVFSDCDTTRSGWGSTTIYRQAPIDTECAVAEVAKHIKEHNDLDSVAIINFILLNTKGR